MARVTATERAAPPSAVHAPAIAAQSRGTRVLCPCFPFCPAVAHGLRCLTDMRNGERNHPPTNARTDAGSGSEGRSLVASLKEVVGGMAHLLGQHVALARAELRTDLRSLASAAALLVVMAVPVVLGYALGMVALALGLAHWLRTPWAFAVVAAGNIVLGLIGIWASVRKMSAVDVGEEATSELRRSVSLLTDHVRNPVRDPNGERHVS